MLLSQKEIEQQKALKKAGVNIAKTDFWTESPNALKLTLGVQQTFSVPNVYSNQVKLQKEAVKLSEKSYEINKALLTRNVQTLYLDMQYLQKKLQQLIYQDSIYNALYKASERRFNAGEADYLEKVTAEGRYFDIRNQLFLASRSLANAAEQLKLFTGIAGTDSLIASDMIRYVPKNLVRDTSAISGNYLLGYYRQNQLYSSRNLKLQKSLFLPDFFVGYLNQGYSYTPYNLRLRFGVSLPLWFPYYTAKIKAARIGLQVADLQLKNAATSIKSEFLSAYAEYEKSQASLKYYEDFGLRQADLIIATSNRMFRAGNINYIIYLQSLNQSLQIRMDYLSALRDYNQAVINLDYL
ncbi:MAG: TolC family protein, partial [Cytophagaceae bacterium]